MAMRLVDPQTNSLLVLYDDAQSIYQAKRRKFMQRVKTSLAELRGRFAKEASR
jgi:hypothetical protein